MDKNCLRAGQCGEHRLLAAAPKSHHTLTLYSCHLTHNCCLCLQDCGVWTINYPGYVGGLVRGVHHTSAVGKGGTIQISIPISEKQLFSKDPQTSTEIHPVLCSVRTGQFFSRKSNQDAQLATDTYLAPGLRISAAIPLLRLSCRHGMDRETFTFTSQQLYAVTYTAGL